MSLSEHLEEYKENGFTCAAVVLPLPLVSLVLCLFCLSAAAFALSSHRRRRLLAQCVPGRAQRGVGGGDAGAAGAGVPVPLRAQAAAMWWCDRSNGTSHSIHCYLHALPISISLCRSHTSPAARTYIVRPQLSTSPGDEQQKEHRLDLFFSLLLFLLLFLLSLGFALVAGAVADVVWRSFFAASVAAALCC